MIPLRDENPTRSRAWMTLLLIGVNVLVSIWEWTLSGESGRNLVQAAALIPARLGGSAPIPGVAPALTLLTSQFLHAGPLHLGGNMLFLWIFGNNVEDELGRFRFLVFYLLSGVAAGLVHCASDPASTIPTVGASGAISGVLGAYAFLFPRARIHTLVFLLFYISVIPIPALLWVGIWFAIQLLQGVASGGAGGGVAWFAHIGGLVAGVFLLPFFRPRRRPERIEPFSSAWRP
jgi:membrane associated rhomboid family serine protease